MRRSQRFFVLFGLGIVIALGGLIYGASSHQAIYKSVGQGSIAHYLSASGTGYLQLSNSPALYIVDETSFTPVIDGINTLRDNDTISFMYDPADTQPIDETSTRGTHLVGSAARVVSLTLMSDTTGQPKTFTTTDYSQHPQGFYKNNWGGGIMLLVVGLLIVVGTFFLSRRKVQPSFSIPPSTRGMQQQPGIAPYQGQPTYTQYPPENPYQTQQPYQGGQYPQYPPQPGQFGPTYGDPNTYPYNQPAQPGQ